MGYQVVLAAQADRDLEAVVTFLAQKNPAAAERLGHALLDTAQALRDFPHRGVAVRGKPDYRRVRHPPWFPIFFRIDEARHLVEIARIWDARQNPASLILK